MNGVILSSSFIDLARMRRRFVERVLLASTALACTQCEPAVTIAVTTTADGGEGSLRSAISAANAGTNTNVQIEIPPGVYELTRCGAADDDNASGDLDFTRTASLTITAPNGNVVIRQTCPGERVLDVLGNWGLTLMKLQITGGSLVATGAGADANGGGVRAQGDVTLQSVIISGNSVRAAPGSAAGLEQASTPGGTARGGGLYVGGWLSADNTAFDLNSATGGVGAAAAGDNVTPAPGGRAEGGGAYVVGAVTLRGGRLSQNTVTGGTGGNAVVPAAGGLARGGGLAQADTSTAAVDLGSVTVVDNLAQGGESGAIAGATAPGDAGPAGAAEGGGIAVAGAVDARLITASRNRAMGGFTGVGEQPLFGTGRANGAAGAALGGALAARGAVTVQSGVFDLNLAVSGDTFFFCATPGCFGGPAAPASGGAVYATAGVTLSSVRFTNNTATRGQGTESGKAVASGGAVVSASLADSGGAYVGNAARAPLGPNTGAGVGGAISAGDVQLTTTRLESNTATGSGGAVAAATLSAEGVTAVSNRAGGAGGGAVHVTGDATIAGATVRHNSVESMLEYNVATLVGGGGISVGGALTISRSWVANNTGHAAVRFSNPRLGTFIIPARFQGGGARANRIVARASTFSGNETVASTITLNMPLPVTAGVSGGGAIFVDGTAELVNATLADNQTLPDPAFLNTAYGALPLGSAIIGGSITFEHVSVIDNQGAAAVQATSLTTQRSVAVAAPGTTVCGAGVVAGASSYNWFSDASCALAGPTNDQESAASLGSLTQTAAGRAPVRSPLPGSVLIDAVPVAACPTLEDANGTPRPQGPGCDVGAVEVRL